MCEREADWKHEAQHETVPDMEQKSLLSLNTAGALYCASLLDKDHSK